MWGRFCLVAGLAPLGVGADFRRYGHPTCEELILTWNTRFAKEIHFADPTLALDPQCESREAQLAFGLDILARHLPDLYQRLYGAKQIALGGPSPDTSLADTDSETQVITIYDSLLGESREFIAAQLAHEAAHLRPEDVDHVKCEKGELKGDEGSCAAEFTGDLIGDAYNFTYFALKELYDLSSTHSDLDRDSIHGSVGDLLRNNFNQVPPEILRQWNVELQ